MAACQKARDAVCLHRRGREARRPLLDQEALDLAVLRTARPDDHHIGDEALPIHRFAPSRTSRLGRDGRVVLSATESGPCIGSFRRRRRSRPARHRGQPALLLFLEPSSAIDFIANPDWTPRNVAGLPSPPCSSMFTSPRAAGSCRAAVALNVLPEKADWAAGASAARAARPPSQYSLIAGSTSWSTKRRVAMKCSHCSSVNWSRTWK